VAGILVTPISVSLILTAIFFLSAFANSSAVYNDESSEIRLLFVISDAS